MMKYYTSLDGEIFAIDTDQDFLIKSEWRELVGAELEAHLNQPKPSISSQVRADRNDLLLASDWTQVADAPVDQVAWASYRQALREVPQQVNFPRDVVWPTKPE